jgi:hypothetical protein
VYAVNSSQIVNGTLNVNETVQLAEDAMMILLADGAAVPQDEVKAEGRR